MILFCMFGLYNSISLISLACWEIKSLLTKTLFSLQKKKALKKIDFYFEGLKTKLRQKWNYKTRFLLYL